MDRKVVLITGASRGIGACTALTFAKNGYDVILVYKSQTVLAEKVQKQVENLGSKCLCVQCDISNDSDVAALEQKVIKYFGRIDCLINNASITNDSLFEEKTSQNFKTVLDTNVVGTFIMSKTFGQMMFANKKGKIINIASTNGIDTYFPMCLEYDASKSAIISLTHNLALQFAPYVNVNAIAPGFIATDSEIKDMPKEFIKSEEQKILKKRAGTEQDVANLVYFLASDEADFINNEVIRIDGGQY